MIIKKIVFSLLSIFCFPIFGQNSEQVPYTNNFNNAVDTVGWSHYAISGISDWELGEPSYGTYFTSAYSTPNAWATNLTGIYSGYSNRALQTPYFDLSDTVADYALSFYQKRNASASGGQYFVEYRLNSDTTWNLLNEQDVLKKNWQGVNGFSSNSFYLIFEHSAIDLDFIQGEDSVQFRFRMQNNYANGYGWLIDNFSIKEHHFNISAEYGDTIKGINKFFEEIEVISHFNFYNQWDDSYEIQSLFYLSEDSVLDANDTLLASIDNSVSQANENWANAINIPDSLSAGIYYIIYNIDALDSLIESDESDNISFAVMHVDSIQNTPYFEDFELDTNLWNNGIYSAHNHWLKGNPNRYYAEKSHSGQKSWYTDWVPNTTGDNYLESPYIDLTTSTNSVICFWYRKNENTYNFKLRLKLPEINGSVITHPFFPNTAWPISIGDDFNINIPPTRRYNYDCYCHDISDYDGQESFKFLMRSYGFNYTDYNGSLIHTKTVLDDFYIGPAKPDISIEGEKQFRFTPSNVTTDTLKYEVYNSGLTNLPITETTFYWSLDSILDSTDIYLGNNIETSISDTVYEISEFVYTKPDTSEDTFFILYNLDSSQSVDEMNENNNSGYFRIQQVKKLSLPYMMDFESTPLGWTHDASWGEDQWMWGESQGSDLYSVYSGTKAFMTMDTGIMAHHSRMHLNTPIFDLTELQTPVLEFDMTFYESSYNITSYSLIKAAKTNLMYSTNGGANWEVLDPSNYSFKKMNTKIIYNTITGIDSQYDFEGETNTIQLYGAHYSKALLGNLSYQGKNYDDNYHYVIDLESLKNETNIQFMFVVVSMEEPSEGALIDNFSIKEGQRDLVLANRKKMMVSSMDAKIRQNVWIKNDANYISESSEVKLYLSIDSILNMGDLPLSSVQIPSLKPFEKYQFNLNYNSPMNYYNYNYLLFEIDPDNTVSEINENNNLDHMMLNMDTAENFTYPILFDFNDTIMDGWYWYNDSTGFYSGHTFRHIKVGYDPVKAVNNGEWFLDPIDAFGNLPDMGPNYPHYYLESPSFDFSFTPNPFIEFDLICIGNSATDDEGGNLQYSMDGGNTWLVLGIPLDTLGTNWYENSNLSELNNEPGWITYNNWHDVNYLATIVGGEPDVRFRFHFRSKSNPYGYKQGLRLDNFEVSGFQLPHNYLNDIELCEGDSLLIFGEYRMEAGTYFDTLLTTNGLDSIIAQELHVIPSIIENQIVTTCNDNYLWPVNGISYNSSGTYSEVFSNVNGCDSILYLDLTILDNFEQIIDTILCFGESLIVGNHSYNTNGVYNDTLTSTSGCDSIIQLNLSVLEYFEETIDTVLCSGEELTVGNHFYSAEGTYHDTLTNTYGCDSIVISHIDYIEINTGISIGSIGIESAQNIGEYQWLNCNDFTIISGETDMVFTPTQEGNYAVQITYNGCIDTSICIQYYFNSIYEILENDIIISPNPFTDVLQINFPKTIGLAEIKLYDSLGRLLYDESRKETSRIELNTFDLPKGVYNLQIDIDGYLFKRKIFK